MADYLPEAFPGDIFTFDAGEAITGGRLVEVGAADMTVVGAVSDSEKVVGVAARDAASGAKVPVYVRGVIHRLKAKGAITRGDVVSADNTDADGEVATSAAEGAGYVQADANRNARANLGLALESIADDGTGRVMFI